MKKKFQAMLENWAEKYRPRNLSEVINQEQAKLKLKQFLMQWHSKQKPKIKAVLMYGPAGTGKTALAYALAAEFDMEVIELNASDFRDKRSIDAVIGNAMQQQSLFARKKLIIVDEVEGISGKEDRGGLAELSKFIDKATWPIILISNNPFDKRLFVLRQKCLLLEIKKLDYRSIIKILQRICKHENIKASSDALKRIAVNAKGDARAAINDLQVIAAGKNQLSLDDVNAYLELATRDKEETIFNALRLVFKSRYPVYDAFNNVDAQLDEIQYWIDENITKEYKGLTLIKAIDALSKANIFLARIQRWQYWRFIVYANIFLTAGITLAKFHDGKIREQDLSRGFVAYSRPVKFQKLWEAKQNIQHNELIAKLASKMHCSKRKTINEWPILKIALGK